MRRLWILGFASATLGACAAVDRVDSRVRTQTVEVDGTQVELLVSEMLPEEGRRRFLIHARNSGPTDQVTPAGLSAWRQAAMDPEMGRLCPAGWEVDGHTEAFTEGLTWLRCNRS